MTLESTIAAIRPADDAAMAAARAHQARLTKPAGSLGALEDLSVRLAGLAGACPPPLPEPATVAVFAGDHGVHGRGVSPWPQEVTAQMVLNFVAGGAVVNAFARQNGADVLVVDVGVAIPLHGGPNLLDANVRRGTRDFTEEPAMTGDEVRRAVETGISVAHALIDGGARCLLTGDMGIGNTTPAAALIAAFTGAEAAAVTGRGTGIDDETFAHKVAVVEQALTRHALGTKEAAEREPAAGTEPAAGREPAAEREPAAGTEPAPARLAQPAERTVVAQSAVGGPDAALGYHWEVDEALRVLAAVGGLEHAALAGFVLGAAERRTPVIVDGVIAASAALVAHALAPDSIAAMVAGHRSAEPGARVALDHLGLTPLLDLGMRLGEGTGALLALPIVASAARVLHDVATFDAAGVSEK